MKRPTEGWIARRWRRAGTLALGALLLGGCLGKPRIEERWTRIDVGASSLASNQTLTPGSRTPITVSMDVTYRKILTGVVVAELRASGSVSPASVELAYDAPRSRMALDIDHILQNSVPLGRATRAVTGWDHLIQHIDFTFDAAAPAVMDSTSSAGLFLVCYLGRGDRMERADGTDTLLVTPFGSTQYEILPVGIELGVAP